MSAPIEEEEEAEAEAEAAGGGGGVRTHEGTTGRPRAEQDRMTGTDDATAGASCHATRWSC
jgi:hypothetical protein